MHSCGVSTVIRPTHSLSGQGRQPLTAINARTLPYPDSAPVTQAPVANLRALLPALEAELRAASAAARGPDGAAVIARALEGLGLVTAPAPPALEAVPVPERSMPAAAAAAATATPAATAAAIQAPPAAPPQGLKSGPGLGLQEVGTLAGDIPLAEAGAAAHPTLDVAGGPTPEGSGFEILLQARPRLPKGGLPCNGQSALSAVLGFPCPLYGAAYNLLL